MAEKLVRVGSPKPLPRQRTKEEKQVDTNFTEKEVVSKPPPAVPAPDCPVCLQPSIHPVKVPCGHVFCFLCVKGASNQSQRCALCRQAIPPSFFESPTLLNDCELSHGSASSTCEKYAWFYEGRNGWWQYDVRTNHEIEEGYRSKKRSFELLIAGYMYIIDLDNMLQIRRSDPSRRRRIKRDLVTAPKKGIAGLKIMKDNEDDETNIEENEEGSATKDNPGTSSSSQTGTSGRTHQNAPPPSQSGHLSSSTDSSPDIPDDRLSDGLQSLSLSYGQGTVQPDTVQDSVNPPEGYDSEEVLEI